MRRLYTPLVKLLSPAVQKATESPSATISGRGSPNSTQASPSPSRHDSASTVSATGSAISICIESVRQPPAEAWIHTRPARLGRSTPAESTVATDGFAERQVTALMKASAPIVKNWLTN